MIGSINAELLVLRKRASTWILLAIWIALAAFFSYGLPYLTYRSSATPAAEPPGALLPHGLGALAGGFPFYGGALALMLGVLSLGGEYGWGTLKTHFTQRPGRLRIFAAKLLALGVVLIPFALLVFAIAAAASAAIVWREGAAMAWPSAWLLARAVVAGWFVLAVWAAFGAMLAVLTRGTALAIGVGILWALAVEGLVSALLNQSRLFRPLIEFFVRANAYSLVRPLGTAVEVGSTDGLGAANDGPGSFAGPFVGWEQALIVLTTYLAGFVAIAALLLRRRDVA